jgi:hypothetical protein
VTTPPAAYLPAAPVARRANPLGLTATILVAAAVVLQFIAAGVTGSLIANAAGDLSLYSVTSGVFVLVQGLIALAAVIVGIAGLVVKDRPHALAGIGLGGGAVIVLGIAASQVTNLVLTLSS